MSIEALLAETLADLSDSLIEEFDVVELLTLLSDRCVELLDVQAAGVMLASPAGELRVVASSSSVMRGLELFEEQSEEGPCQDCYVTGHAVVNAKLATLDGRWPRFAPKALAAGFHSAHALPMRLSDLTIGALNLFRIHQGLMTRRDTVIAQNFADVATRAILENRTAAEAQDVNEQATVALHARIAIEQAKGVVSERTGLNINQSFSLLRNHAANHHIRLVKLARSVVDGTVDAATLDPLH